LFQVVDDGVSNLGRIRGCSDDCHGPRVKKGFQHKGRILNTITFCKGRAMGGDKRL